MTVNIPGYKIIRTLGKGGMATVYLAVQEIFEREVALKVMSRGLADDPAFGQRFLREARIVSQLVHPNIVTVYDVGVHDDAYYLSMEYIKGKDLKQAAKDLSFVEKIDAVVGVAKALDYAGGKGYVHRDIKPENVMLSEHDKRAVLMDFGIARAAETDITVTQAGTAIGTPHYMSPEQAKGLPVDARADLYGLGVVFFMILMGYVPYDAESAVAIGIKHITDPLPVFPPHYQFLQPILDRMMAKDPDDRFQTGAEVVDAMASIDLAYHADEVESFLAAQRQQIEQEIDSPTLLNTSQSAYDRAFDETIHAPELDPNRFTQSFDLPEPTTKRSRLLTLSAAASLIIAVTYFYVLPEDSSDLELPRTINVDNAQGEMSTFIRGKDIADSIVLKGSSEKTGEGILKEIKALEARYEVNDKFLSDLAKKYRELETFAPNNRSVKSAIHSLALDSIRRIKPLIDAGNFKAAQQQYDLTVELFPEVKSDFLAEQRSRLVKRIEIKSLMSKASDQYKKGRRYDPFQESALDLYLQILAIDDGLLIAKKGRDRVLADMVGDAHKALRRGDMDNGQRLLDSVFAIDKSFDEALKLQEKFKTSGEKQKSVSELFEQAESYIDKEQYYQPANKNAYEAYRAILNADPGNREAKAGLQRLHDLLAKRAKDLVNDGEYEEAKASLEAAQAWREKEGAFQLLLLSIDEAIVEHKYRNR